MSDELKRITHERDTLAAAIRDAAVKAGIARADARLAGPLLVMLCDDLASVALAEADGAKDAGIASIETNAGAMIILTQDYTREQKVRAVDAHMRRQVAPLTESVLAWWDEHEHDTYASECDGRPIPIYGEAPAFVNLAMKMQAVPFDGEAR